MMSTKIKNLEGISTEQVLHEISQGARFVHFQFCISIVVMTFRRPTKVYYIRPGESSLKYGILPSLVSFLFGWWGIPWGPIYTIQSFIKNLSGGTDITSNVLANIRAAAQSNPSED